MRYQKIEEFVAIQWTGDNLEEVQKFCRDYTRHIADIPEGFEGLPPVKNGLWVHLPSPDTRHGVIYRPSDWILVPCDTGFLQKANAEYFQKSFQPKEPHNA